MDDCAKIKRRKTAACRRLFRLCFRVLLRGRLFGFRFSALLRGRRSFPVFLSFLLLQGLGELIGDGLKHLGSLVAVDKTVLQAIENEEGRDVSRIHHGSERAVVAIIRVVAGQA